MADISIGHPELPDFWIAGEATLHVEVDELLQIHPQAEPQGSHEDVGENSLLDRRVSVWKGQDSISRIISKRHDDLPAGRLNDFPVLTCVGRGSLERQTDEK